MNEPTDNQPEINTSSQSQEEGGFPRSLLSVSRAEFYGQDSQHQPLKLMVRDGKTGQETQLPDELQGHVFIIGPVGSVDSPKVSEIHSNIVGDNVEELDKNVLPSQDGWTPLLNGDGMIYRLDFHTNPLSQETGQAWLTTRLVKTPAFYADKITSLDPKYRQFKFRNFGLSRYSLILGLCNQVNTAFLPLKFPGEKHQRLAVTNEVSRPYEIDPISLKAIAPIGLNSEWQQSTKTTVTFPFRTIISSAHPCFDTKTGEMFTVNILKSLKTLFGSSNWGKKDRDLDDDVATTSIIKQFQEEILRTSSTALLKLVEFFENIFDRGHEEDIVYLLRWNGKGPLQKWKLVLPDGQPVKFNQACHMLWATKKYVVLADAAFKLAPGNMLPGFVITKLNNWIQTIEKNIEKITEETITERIESKIEEIVKWLTTTLNYQQSPDTYVYIVSREQLNQIDSGESVTAKQVKVEGEFTHFVIDYDNPKDKVIIHAGMNYATDPGEFIRKQDNSVYDDPDLDSKLKQINGMMASGMDVNSPAAIAIDPESQKVNKYDLNLHESIEYSFFIGLYAYRDDMPTESLNDIYWTGGGAWPEMFTKSIYNLYEDYKYRKLTLKEVLKIIRAGIPVMLFRVHIDRNELLGSDKADPNSVLSIPDHYSFPRDYYPSSPQFVPRAGKEGSTEGYIVCTVIRGHNLISNTDEATDNNWSSNSEIWIFDAHNLKEGPLYKLSHAKLNVGLTIHTTWLEQLDPQPPRHYDIRQDFDPLVSKAKSEYSKNPLLQLLTGGKGRQIAQKIEDLFDEVYQSFEED